MIRILLEEIEVVIVKYVMQNGSMNIIYKIWKSIKLKIELVVGKLKALLILMEHLLLI